MSMKLQSSHVFVVSGRNTTCKVLFELFSAHFYLHSKQNMNILASKTYGTFITARDAATKIYVW